MLRKLIFLKPGQTGLSVWGRNNTMLLEVKTRDRHSGSVFSKKKLTYPESICVRLCRTRFRIPAACPGKGRGASVFMDKRQRDDGFLFQMTIKA